VAELNLVRQPGKGDMLYGYLTWREVEDIDKKRALAVLPIGSVEQHGFHLPLLTDTEIAYRLCVQAFGGDPRVFVLPPVWWGSATCVRDYPGTISLRPSTLLALLSDIFQALEADGWHHLLMVNSHGGNPGVLNAIVRECQEKGLRLRIYYQFVVDLYRDLANRLRESKVWGHACEIETSLALALFPERVQMERAQASEVTSPSREWVFNWRTFNPIGVHGDPTLATREKGEQLLQEAIKTLRHLAEEILKGPDSGLSIG